MLRSMLVFFSLLFTYQVSSAINITVTGLRTTNSVFSIRVDDAIEEEIRITSNATLKGILNKPITKGSSTIDFEKLMCVDSGIVEIAATGLISKSTAVEVINVEKAIQKITLILSHTEIKLKKSFELRIYLTDENKSPWLMNTTLFISDDVNNYEVWTNNGSYTKKITYDNHGKYTLSVKSSDGVSVIKRIEVKNWVSKISSYFNSNSTTAFFPALFTIKIYGGDLKLYSEPINVTIYYKSGVSKTTEEEIIIANGSKELEILYQKYSDNASCTVDYRYLSTYLSSSSYIRVNPNKIVIFYGEDGIPEETKDSFEFDLKIMDYNEEKIEKNYGSHELSFELTSKKSRLSGSQQNVTTKDGQAKINDLYLNSTGTYQLKILCDSCETYISKEFEIKSICDFSIVSLCVLGILVFLLVILAAGFHFSDRYINNEDRYNENLNRPLLYQPLISLFIQQNANIRIINSLQLLVSELTIFTLIGLFYFYYEAPTKGYDKNFYDYDGRQFHKGATGWAAAQVLNIPLFYFKAYSVINLNKRHLFYTTCMI